MCIGKVSSRFNRRRAALADPRFCPVLRFLPTRTVLIEFDIAVMLPCFLHIIKLFARKDTKWIYDLFMCGMIRPSFVLYLIFVYRLYIKRINRSACNHRLIRGWFKGCEEWKHSFASRRALDFIIKLAFHITNKTTMEQEAFLHVHKTMPSESVYNPHRHMEWSPHNNLPSKSFWYGTL